MSMYGKKPLQYCKVISLQLIKINEKKKKECWSGLPFPSPELYLVHSNYSIIIIEHTNNSSCSLIVFALSLLFSSINTMIFVVVTI